MDVNARREGTEVQEFTSGKRADVLIIGGGIGGLAAATALTQKGLTVKLYERQREFGEVGAGMQIASNCTSILDDLGLLDEAKRLGVVPDRMVMKDAVDGRELIHLDLRRVEERYGTPYMVIHRSDLHGIFLRAAQRQGVELHGGAKAVAYDNVDGGARVTFDDGSTDEADVVIAADGIHSVARASIVQDEPVSSAYVAYRGAVPIELAAENDIDPDAVQVYVGPGCHFVQYALRAGEMFNQVAVFESPKALAGQDDWGTPDEMDSAFAETCEQVQKGLPLMWRNRGEDGTVDWDATLAAYDAVRPEHCRRILTTGRVWGELWHLRDEERLARNAVFDGLDPHEWAFTDWVWGPTALFPEDEPAMYEPIPIR